MHSCICYHRSTRPWTVCIFILHLSVRPFSGLVGEADSPPIVLTPAFWRSCHLTNGLFCFTRYIPTPWIFSCAGFSAVYDMDSLSMDPFRSWGSLWWFHVSNVFGGGSKMVCYNYNHLRASRISWFTNIIRGFALVSGFLFSWLLFSVFFRNFISCLPVCKELQNYQRNCYTMASNVLGSILHDLLFCLSVTKKFSTGSLNCSLTGWLSWP